MDSSSCPIKLNSVHSPRSWVSRSYYCTERVRACLNVQLRLYITLENYGIPVGSQKTAYPAVKHYYKGGQTGGLTCVDAECHQECSTGKVEPDGLCVNDISVRARAACLGCFAPVCDCAHL